MKTNKILCIVLVVAMLTGISVMGFANSTTETTLNPDGTKTVIITYDDGSVWTGIYYSNGDIKSVTSKSDSYESTSDYVYDYYEDGTKKSVVRTDSDGTIRKNFYDENGKEISRFFKNNEYWYNYEYKYHENGNKKTEVKTGSDEYRYETNYNEEEKIETNIVTRPSGYVEKTSYDEKGYSVTVDKASGKVIGEYKLNNDGTATRWYDYGMGLRDITEYDKNGNQTMTTEIFPDGSLFIINYDEHGNNISDTFIYANGDKEITTYTDNEFLYEKHDGNDKIIGELKEQDGGFYEWNINKQGDTEENYYNYDKELLKNIKTSADGYVETTVYSSHFDYKIFNNDKLVGECSFDYPKNQGYSWHIDKNGKKTEKFYGVDGRSGEYLASETITYADGYVENIVYAEDGDLELGDDYIIYNIAKEEVGERKTDKQGNVYVWHLDKDGNKTEEYLVDLRMEIIPVSKVITDKGGEKVTHTFDYDKKHETISTYDAAGKLLNEETWNFKNVLLYKTVKSSNGNIESEYKLNDDGTTTECYYDDIGAKNVTEYDKNGNLTSYTKIHTDGYKETTTWDEKGNSKTVDGENNIIAETKTLPDGSTYKMEVFEDDNKHEWNHDTDNNLTSYTFTRPDGYKKQDLFENGKKVITITTDEEGDVRTTTWDDKGNNKTVDSDGKLVGERIINEDGSRNEWRDNKDGDRNSWVYDKDGKLVSRSFVYTNETSGYVTTTQYDGDNNKISEKRVSPFGYTETTTYDDKGNSETVNSDDKVIATKTMLEDGGYEEWYIREDGSESLTVYDKNENELRGVETNADGVKTYTEYLGKVKIPIGPNSYRTYMSTRRFDENGNQISETRFDENGDMIVSWYIDEKGARHDFVQAEDGSEIRTITNADGTVETRTTIYNEDGHVVKDADGKVLETYTKTVDEKTGDTYSVTKDGDGKVVYEYFYNKETGLNKRWYLDSDGNKWESIYDYDEKVRYENVYDTAGNLVIERVYDLNGILLSEKKYEVQKVEKVKYVWYPSNTTSTHGFAFRELRPELTEKWYRFTPLDLSREGEYSIPLIGGGKYIIGKVNVKVEGDEVTITYSMPGQQYDTARIESEYLNLLPDLASLTTVEPDELGEGFAFGEPISIENDLEGDTKVLLFIRNVVTFRDHYTYQKPLSRYWPNSSNYAEYYAYLKSIMD